MLNSLLIWMNSSFFLSMAWAYIAISFMWELLCSAYSAMGDVLGFVVFFFNEGGGANGTRLVGFAFFSCCFFASMRADGDASRSAVDISGIHRKLLVRLFVMVI